MNLFGRQPSLPTALAAPRPGPTLRRVAVSPGFRAALPWLLGSLGIAMTALIGQVPFWALLSFAGCAAWRQLIENRDGQMPSLGARLAIFLPTTLGILMTYGPRPGAAGMLAFLVALLSLKVLELRTHRDFVVVALLGYFMILSAFFYNQGLALSLYLALALATNTIALIRCHDGGRRDARRASVRLALALMLQAVPLVVLLFVVFPRIPGNLFRQIGGASTGLTGMSEHLQPGSVDSLAQSDAVAFHARIGTGGELAPRYLYWRGLVLGVCETAMSWRADTGYTFLQAQPPAPGEKRIEQLITLNPQGERWLFALDLPVAVRPSSSLRPQLMNANVLRSPAGVFSKSIYTAISNLSPPLPAELTDGQRLFYTHVPANLSRRVLALAQGWMNAAPPLPGAARDYDIIRQARLYFRDGGFIYTLSPGALPADGALDYFLFQSRRGFCEHYAAAFSTLLRAAGLPARIVVGYQGGEYNSWNGQYAVRQSDAHAWSEVWVTGRGWQREDPTAVVAPERVSYGAESYEALTADGPLTAETRLERFTMLNSPGTWHWLIRNCALAWDGMDQQWNLLVLGYDSERREDTLQNLGLGSLDWVEGAALALTVAFALLALGALSVRALDRVQSAGLDPAARLYERFCRRVAQAAGIERAAAEGPLDFSRRAVTALPEQTRAIQAITDLYVRSRYAPPVHDDLASRTLEALREAVETFRAPKRTAR